LTKEVRLQKLREIRETISQPHLRLSTTETRNATIVLNTLDWIAKDPEKVNARTGKERNTFLPDFPGANDNNACLIHLSSTDPNSPYSNKIPEGPEGVKLILGSWVDIFIFAFQKANALGPAGIKEFCSQLNGVCIDSRTRDAISYGMSLDAPESFSGYLHRAITSMHPYHKDSYFACFSSIQNACWEKNYFPDTKSKYKTQYAEQKGIFDESTFPLIKRYLSDLGLKPNSDFIVINDTYNNKAMVFKFVLSHPGFLDEIGLPEIVTPPSPTVTADKKDEKTDTVTIASQYTKLQESFKLAQQKALQTSMTADNSLLRKAYDFLLVSDIANFWPKLWQTHDDLPLVLTALKRTNFTYYKLVMDAFIVNNWISRATWKQLNQLLQVCIDQLKIAQKTNPDEFNKYINEPDHFFKGTLLYFAAERKLYPIVNQLLELGEDVNRTSNTGVTPLMHAVLSQYIRIPEESADDAKTRYANTVYAFINRTDIQIDINEKDILQFALTKNIFFIKNNIDVFYNTFNLHERIAREKIAKNDYQSAVQIYHHLYLESQKEKSPFDYYKITQADTLTRDEREKLASAFFKKNYAFIFQYRDSELFDNLLIWMGNHKSETLKTIDGDKNTILHTIVSQNIILGRENLSPEEKVLADNKYETMLTILLNIAPSLINVPNQDGLTPIHFTINSNNTRIAKLLLNHQQPRDEKSEPKPNITPLVITALNPCVTIETFKFVLEQKETDINARYTWANRSTKKENASMLEHALRNYQDYGPAAGSAYTTRCFEKIEQLCSHPLFVFPTEDVFRCWSTSCSSLSSLHFYKINFNPLESYFSKHFIAFLDLEIEKIKTYTTRFPQEKTLESLKISASREAPSNADLIDKLLANIQDFFIFLYKYGIPFEHYRCINELPPFIKKTIINNLIHACIFQICKNRDATLLSYYEITPSTQLIETSPIFTRFLSPAFIYWSQSFNHYEILTIKDFSWLLKQKLFVPYYGYDTLSFLLNHIEKASPWLWDSHGGYYRNSLIIGKIATFAHHVFSNKTSFNPDCIKQSQKHLQKFLVDISRKWHRNNIQSKEKVILEQIILRLDLELFIHTHKQKLIEPYEKKPNTVSFFANPLRIYREKFTELCLTTLGLASFDDPCSDHAEALHIAEKLKMTFVDDAQAIPIFIYKNTEPYAELKKFCDQRKELNERKHLELKNELLQSFYDTKKKDPIKAPTPYFFTDSSDIVETMQSYLPSPEKTPPLEDNTTKRQYPD
jgi:ankyrin repeat protein